MKFCSLYSGSSGNSLFVSHGQTSLLIDAGMSGIKIQNAMKAIEEDPKKLKGILVTHEHRDHIHGIGVLSRRFDLPVYATTKTWEAMGESLGKIAENNRKTFESGEDLNIEELQIRPFKTSHDAAESCGFVIDDGTCQMGIATDTGVVTEQMIEALMGCKLTVIESNHDLGMLEAGAYPFYLKQRIKSDFGHLSNEVAGNLVKTLVENGTETVLLAHLSQENNFPLLAYETTSRILSEAGINPQKDICLAVAKRSCVSEIIKL
ncbi:MBL fold metallo-hydrolase [Eubacteriaceae bacterium ES3]|nr:MBL fold metallo-hydrolase [Eubacteriaceae bacterium ES3]